MNIKESIIRILSEETQIPSAIRRRISSEDIEEAFDYALERMGGSMNNPNSIIYKEKGTTLGTFAKFVIDEMVTYIEQDYFNDNNRIYFSDTEEDEETYHEKIRKPLLRHYGKRIKEKYNEVMSSNDDEIIQEHIIRILKEETSLQLRLRNVIRTHGLKKAIKSVGGVNNFKKIFNNDFTIIYEELDPPYHHNLWEMGFDVDDRIEIFKLIFGDDIEIEGIDNGGDIYVYQEVGGNVGINRPYYEYFDGTHWEYREFDENGYVSYMTDSEGREVKLKHDDEGRQTYLEIPSTREWEKWEYDDQGEVIRYETSWGTYKDFTKEKNLNESYRFKLRRLIHFIEDYIDDLKPEDICNYWTLSEEDDYVRQTMLELVRFIIDELKVESEYYTDVYDEIYGHVIDFGYQDKIRDFFIYVKDNHCGGYHKD